MTTGGKALCATRRRRDTVGPEVVAVLGSGAGAAGAGRRSTDRASCARRPREAAGWSTCGAPVALATGSITTGSVAAGSMASSGAVAMSAGSTGACAAEGVSAGSARRLAPRPRRVDDFFSASRNARRLSGAASDASRGVSTGSVTGESSVKEKPRDSSPPGSAVASVSGLLCRGWCWSVTGIEGPYFVSCTWTVPRNLHRSASRPRRGIDVITRNPTITDW